MVCELFQCPHRKKRRGLILEDKRRSGEKAFEKTKDQSFLTGLMELMTGFEPVTSSLPTRAGSPPSAVFRHPNN